jgi:hypothetical protein
MRRFFLGGLLKEAVQGVILIPRSGRRIPAQEVSADGEPELCDCHLAGSWRAIGVPNRGRQAPGNTLAPPESSASNSQTTDRLATSPTLHLANLAPANARVGRFARLYPSHPGWRRPPSSPI